MTEKTITYIYFKNKSIRPPPKKKKKNPEKCMLRKRD